MTNGSMWEIVGSSQSYVGVGSGTKIISVFKGSSALSQPEFGVKSDYFMLINGSPYTFFIRQLTGHTIHATGVVSMSNQSKGNIFRMNDGFMWEIVGSSKSYVGVGSGTRNISIYRGSSSLSQPEFGITSEYFMLLNESPYTFFLKPLQ